MNSSTIAATTITWSAPNAAARWSSFRAISNALSKKLAARTSTCRPATLSRFTAFARDARRNRRDPCPDGRRGQVILRHFPSVTWACGPPIGTKIHHGGTEITEKTREKLKARVLRVSVVNDFRRSGAKRETKADPLTTALHHLPS